MKQETRQAVFDVLNEDGILDCIQSGSPLENFCDVKCITIIDIDTTIPKSYREEVIPDDVETLMLDFIQVNDGFTFECEVRDGQK